MDSSINTATAWRRMPTQKSWDRVKQWICWHTQKHRILHSSKKFIWNISNHERWTLPPTQKTRHDRSQHHSARVDGDCGHWVFQSFQFRSWPAFSDLAAGGFSFLLLHSYRLPPLLSVVMLETHHVNMTTIVDASFLWVLFLLIHIVRLMHATLPKCSPR